MGGHSETCNGGSGEEHCLVVPTADEEKEALLPERKGGYSVHKPNQTMRVNLDAIGVLDKGETGPLNYASNILLVYRLQEMRSSATLNFWLAILCLMYCGVNIALIYVNYINSHYVPDEGDDDDDDLPVSELAFHLTEFWATFGFAVLECVSLASTPKSLLRIYDNPLFLKLIMFFNIVAALVPAVLVTLNLEVFEIISHEVEYLNELTMSFVDLVLLWSLCRLGDASEGRGRATITLTACAVAFVQLWVYNGMGRAPDGDMAGEVPAHYLEFAFEIISSLIAFWFCMDNKFVADKEIGLILYGRHKDCNICGAKSKEFAQTYAPLSSYGTIHLPA